MRVSAAFSFLWLLKISLVASAPETPTDVFINPCGFIEDTIEIPSPPSPSPPPFPPSSPPPPKPPPRTPPPKPPPRSPPPSPPPPFPPPPSGCGTNADTQCGGILPTYSYSPGTLYTGGEIYSNDTSISASSCALTCLGLTGCVVFSKNITTRTCTFMNSSAVPGPNVASESWLLCNDPADRSSAQTSGRKLRRHLLQNNSPFGQYWSDPATWPGGIVPGIGNAKGVNATIPCGKIVILDLPNLTLDLLRIHGLLRFLDDPRIPQIYVKANFVLVIGQLVIGSASQQYRQRAIIELTPHPKRAQLQYIYSAPADPANPRYLGHKSFVVVGGQVRLHGLPGPSNMPVWVRLSKNANVNDRSIQVDADVAGIWPAGMWVVLTSSDYERNQTEKLNIVKVTSTGSGQSIISLRQPLKYKHYGTIHGLSDGFGGFVDERAEVLLLSRRIVITSTDEPAPYNLEGGHFMIYMTPDPPQYIEGVEFSRLGQQGTAGRYPINLCSLGSVPQTVIRKNFIHQSKQRCIVVQATHNVTFESNVAYNTSGHCFALEEGGEENNTFVDNVGVLTNPVSVRISSDETDNKPATFWITNLRNFFIRNVAAGSAESGFTFELRVSVRGNSLKIPSINNTIPRWGIISLFLNNTAHSNGVVGLTTSPLGMTPRLQWSTFGGINVLDGIRSYKNAWIGMLVQYSDSMQIKNSIFSDNGWGIQLHKSFNINVTDGTLIGLSNNYGNPSNCSDEGLYGNCIPANPNTCTMPLKWGTTGRSLGWRPRGTPTFGITISQTGGYLPYTLKNLRFSNFSSTCAKVAAIATVGIDIYWDSGNNVEGLLFTNNSVPAWIVPRFAKLSATSQLTDSSENALFYTIFDKDGSFNNGKRGYLVANTSEILPPSLTGCTARPEMNAYTCAGVCYRSVRISYPERGYSPQSVKNRDNFSYLKITRVSDSTVLFVDGNQNSYTRGEFRDYTVSLLANQVYRVEIIAPTFNPSFMVDKITIELRSFGECGQGVSFQFVQVANKPWVVPTSSTVIPKVCSGVEPENVVTAQFSPLCINNKPWIQIDFPAHLYYNSGGYTYTRIFELTLTRSSSADGVVCPTKFNCSLSWSGKSWLYDDSGLERRPAFYNPILSKPQNWKNGTSPFSSYTLISDKTLLKSPSSSLRTYYFRGTFNLSNAGCYSALNLEIYGVDGTIVYLNNIEILRINLLSGYVDNKTDALTYGNFGWNSYTIPLNATAPFALVDGINTIAVEEHVYKYGTSATFDMRIIAVKGTSYCSMPQVPKPEACDGLDNDLDGMVDNGPSGLFTKPCSTACGTGIMTCIDGYFQQCTAISPQNEICDGLDNNCDGLVDNGKDQMDCTNGSTCYQGKCTPLVNATIPVQIWGRGASGWYYNDSGEDLNLTVPTWATGNTTENWSQGAGPLGYDRTIPYPTWQNITTKINTFALNTASLTAYFAKPFTLREDEVNSTFNIDFSLRRADGAVVYLNGVELWRDNINWGTVQYNSGATLRVSSQDNNLAYWNCRNCRRNNSGLLRAGTNYITAEIHLYYIWSSTAAFDLDLYRNVIVPCFSGNCVRQVEQSIFSSGSIWKFMDARAAPPPDTWMTAGFDDSAWPSGQAPLGYNVNHPPLVTIVQNGSTGGSELIRTLYFRQLVNVPDVACYVSLSTSIYLHEGIVFYINGVEAVRAKISPGPVNSSTYANNSHFQWSTHNNLFGGWLKPGINVFAFEAHRTNFYWTNSMAFDAALTGLREGTDCGDASLSKISWRNGNVTATI